MANGDAYPSTEKVITLAMRLITLALFGLLAWTGRSIIKDVSELQANNRSHDRQIIRLQEQRISDSDKLDDIDRKIEAIRQMLVSGEIRVVTREVE